MMGLKRSPQLQAAQDAHPLDLVARLDYIDRRAFDAHSEEERQAWYAARRSTCGGTP